MQVDHRHKAEGRWICFSKSNRCPICQRPDGKCRHRGEFHHCWKGDTHTPPDVAINSVVLIDGQHWKKIADNCGFAKNSTCFVPVKGFYTKQASGRQHVTSVKVKPRNIASADVVLQFLRQVDQALSVPDFDNAHPDELKKSFDLINHVHAASLKLLPIIRKLAITSAAVEDLMPAVEAAVKDIKYQQLDVDFYRRHYFGDPILNGWIKS